MWIQFAPAAVRWLTFACFIVLVLAVLAMPKQERARMFRGVSRRRARTRPSATLEAPSMSNDVHNPSVPPGSYDLPLEPSRSLRTVGPLAIAARFVLAAAAVVIVVLLAWMAIAFVLSVPGWR